MGYNYSSGYKTSKKAKWSAVTIRRILQNEVYIGTLVQGKKTNVAVPRDEWIITKDAHEPIISQEVFDVIQIINRENKANFYKNKGKNDKYGKKEGFLKSKLICGECGKHMIFTRKVNTRSVSYWYKCYIHDRYGKEHCIKKNIKKDDLENIVFKLIKNQINIFLDMNSIIKDLKKKKRFVEKDMFLKSYDNELQKYSNMKKSTYEDYISNKIDRQKYLDIVNSINYKVTELEKIKDEKFNNSYLPQFNFSNFNYTQKLMNSYKSKRKLTQEMVDTFIENITIYENGNIDVKFNFQNEFNQIIKLKEISENGGDIIAG